MIHTFLTTASILFLAGSGGVGVFAADIICDEANFGNYHTCRGQVVEGGVGDLVSCQGSYSCVFARITAATTLSCIGFSSCLAARINTATPSIYCDGYQSCMFARFDLQDPGAVRCKGHRSCYGAEQIVIGYDTPAEVNEVWCEGSYSCANVRLITTRRVDAVGSHALDNAVIDTTGMPDFELVLRGYHTSSANIAIHVSSTTIACTINCYSDHCSTTGITVTLYGNAMCSYKCDGSTCSSTPVTEVTSSATVPVIDWQWKQFPEFDDELKEWPEFPPTPEKAPEYKKYLNWDDMSFEWRAVFVMSFLSGIGLMTIAVLIICVCRYYYASAAFSKTEYNRLKQLDSSSTDC